jgi:HEPN domain-containing protein
MKKIDIKNSADLFFYKSTIDINSAKVLFDAFKSGNIELDLEVIMFHLQQATEKLFKSLLSQYKVRVLKTHDLEDLYRLCQENNIALIDEIETLLLLSDYVVEGRYAIICDDIEEIENYIKRLEKFIEFTKKEIR